MMKKIPDPIDKHVGSRVRMQRLLLGVSQEKFRDALGLTFQEVQKYEKGTNRIGAGRLQKIASVLQVAPSFFFDDAPEMSRRKQEIEATVPTYVPEFLVTAEDLILVKAFAEIGDPKLLAYEEKQNKPN
jgi:transcriptional regulator with XRE-family HTH domain